MSTPPVTPLTNAPPGLPNNGNLYMTSSEASDELLLSMFRRFKGIDADVDRRMDAAIGEVLRQPLITSVIPMAPNEPRVPFYFEGGPGEGKTSLVEYAAARFCKYTGLNLVVDPGDDYVPHPNDLYFFTSSMQGQTNAHAIGGMPSKGVLVDDASAAGHAKWAQQALQQKAETIGDLFGLKVSATTVSSNEREVVTVVLDGDKEDATDAARDATQRVIDQLTKGASTRGFGFSAPVTADRDAQKYYLAQAEKDGKVYIRLDSPKALSAAAQYVSEMLPNRRFALSKMARFVVCNFDDVANAVEPVRNVLLEIAQKNRYAGVADLGRNAVVTFTGNVGDEDGTNTMSEQSDAEITRLRKICVYDTPGEWAERIRKKYGSSVAGDCLFGALIEKIGNEAGMFRPLSGHDRAPRGVPKATARSLENALASVRPYFQMAAQAGISPTVFEKKIVDAIHSTVGTQFAERYRNYFKSVFSDALPLAEALLANGSCDEELLFKRLGSGVRAAELDFAFQFTNALVEAFVSRVAQSEESRACIANQTAFDDLCKQSMRNLAFGLSETQQPDKLTLAMSQVMARLGQLEQFGVLSEKRIQLRESFAAALAAGFRTSLDEGHWGWHPNAEQDFAMATQGTTTLASVKVPGRPTPR